MVPVFKDMEGNASRKAQLAVEMESRPGHSMSCQLAWSVPVRGVGAISWVDAEATI